MNKIKVLMVVSSTTSHFRNGLTNHVEHLALKLHEVCDLTLLTAFPKMPSDRFPESMRVVYLDCNNVPNYSYTNHAMMWITVNNVLVKNYQFLKELIKTEGYNVIHVQDYFFASIIEIAKELNIPIVSTVHAIGNTLNKLNDNIRNYMMHNSCKIVTVSMDMKKKIHSQFQEIEDGNVVVIPNGIVISPKTDIHTARLPMQIVYAGRLVQIKGVDVLVKAFATLVQDFPTAQLVIAGKGEEEQNLRDLVNGLSLTEKVSFLGEINTEQVREVFASSGIVVIPSRYEPFGIVALEAMAEYTPIIASATGGLNEILSDEYSALLVPPENVIELSFALKRLLTDSNLGEGLANNAYQEVCKYSWEQIAEKTLEVYKNVIEKRDVHAVTASHISQ